MFSPETSLRDLAGLAAILVGGLLALIVALYRKRQSSHVEDLTRLKY